ncbi:MAG TPA: hypothetical protein VH079_19375 [Terriglobales bacterium]|jgi:hypothetical protein|nr:hypothetical protein [Terriglobales bacterium]
MNIAFSRRLSFPSGPHVLPGRVVLQVLPRSICDDRIDLVVEKDDEPRIGYTGAPRDIPGPVLQEFCFG